MAWAGGLVQKAEKRMGWATTLTDVSQKPNKKVNGPKIIHIIKVNK